MPTSFAEVLRGWQNFYLLIGGASATLVGLMLVALSFASNRIVAETGDIYRALVTPTVFHLGSVLIVGTFMSIPTLTTGLLGSLLLLPGVIGVIVCITIIWRITHRQHPPLDKDDLLWHVAVPLISYLGLIGVGLWLVSGALDALNGIAPTMILLLIVGIRNSWSIAIWLTSHR